MQPVWADEQPRTRLPVTESSPDDLAHLRYALDLALQPVLPPDVLYHGTASRFLKSILASGLRAGNRRHVHLSGDVDTARRVGARHGFPVILHVDTARMRADGAVFYRSDNGVWLTGPVAPRYLRVLDGNGAGIS